MGDVKAAYNRMVTSLKENSRNIVLYPEFGSDLSQILKFMEEYFKREPKPIEVEFEVITNGHSEDSNRCGRDRCADDNGARTDKNKGSVGEDSRSANFDSGAANE